MGTEENVKLMVSLDLGEKATCVFLLQHPPSIWKPFFTIDLFSCVNFPHSSRNIDSRWKVTKYVFVLAKCLMPYLQMIMAMDTSLHTFISINKNKGVKRFSVFARGLHYLSSMILSGEI